MTDAPPTTGLHHVTNICTDMDETVAFYEDALGWYTVKRDAELRRSGDAPLLLLLDADRRAGDYRHLLRVPGLAGGRRPGASHHFAFGVERRGDAPRVARPPPRAGVRVSEVKDRTYFKSIYFSDPDGLVFELATEGQGSPATRRSPAVRRSTRSRKGTRSKRFAERTRVVRRRRRYRYCRRRRYRYCRRRRYR